MGTFTDLTGSRFGSLVALRAERVQGRWHWLCGCDCGAVKSIFLGYHPTPEAAHAAYLAAKRIHHEGNQL